MSTRQPAAGQRYFEFVDAKSSKFWEITTSGNDVTVRFGRIGTSGQTKTKTFGDAAAAQMHADKLIDEKTGKGYVEK
jgi:predicted DNA-binding WGR domain protein